MHRLLLLVLALVAIGAAAQPVGPAAGQEPRGPGAPSVLQMNLCLSGAAGCYGLTRYPAALVEAEERISEHTPDVVTLNEVCSGDVRRLAREVGYRARFAAVLVDGAPLACVDPAGRGDFGMAVLTRDRVRSSRSRPLAAMTEPEQRRWLCVTTSRGLTACTGHLATRATATDRFANDLECVELRRVLARYAAAGATLFAGDVNRHRSCAPSGMWTTDDATATQASGIQHVYGSAPLGVPVTQVVGATRTDHDFLSVGVAGG